MPNGNIIFQYDGLQFQDTTPFSLFDIAVRAGGDTNFPALVDTRGYTQPEDRTLEFHTNTKIATLHIGSIDISASASFDGHSFTVDEETSVKTPPIPLPSGVVSLEYGIDIGLTFTPTFPHVIPPPPPEFPRLPLPNVSEKTAFEYVLVIAMGLTVFGAFQKLRWI
jgi:hypothetical protein